MRPLRFVWWSLWLLGCWTANSVAALPVDQVPRAANAPASVTAATPAPASSSTTPPATDITAPAAAGITRPLTLKQMGGYGPIKLRGQDPNGTLNVAVRNDEVVTGAKLRLVYTYSPSLIYSLSHLKVFLNGEVVG